MSEYNREASIMRRLWPTVLKFVANVPDDGSDEMKHAALVLRH